MTEESLNFSNPDEELAYLRSRVLEAEKRAEEEGKKIERPAIIRESVVGLRSENILRTSEERQTEAMSDAETLSLSNSDKKFQEIISLSQKKGVLHTLSVMEKLKDWHLEDEFHNYLIDLVEQGLPPKGLREKGREFKALQMSLFEIILPRGAEGDERSLPELIRGMEQFYAGLLSISGKGENHITFEIANPEGEEDTRIFVSVPNIHTQLFEKQLLALFPKVRLHRRERDYNIFSESGFALGAVANLSASPAYPLKAIENFGEDPVNVIINGFSKIPSRGAGAALQIVFKPRGDFYTKKYSNALKNIEKGEKPKDALREEGVLKEILRAFVEILFKKEKKDEEKKIDEDARELIKSKITSPIVETNIRLVVSADSEEATSRLMDDFESAFNQFENPGRQSFKWNRLKDRIFQSKNNDFYRSYIFRLFRKSEILPLNLQELSNILHLHPESIARGGRLSRLTSKSASAPLSLRDTGTLLGINRYQGEEKKIFISADDRLRHIYTIGQTGTGKSTLLKNMVVEDIRRGEGVCFIDPHGSDIQDVLASVPQERMDDVIYFDPADTERPMGLNMLEYDPRFPEQKTFVVNELFSIFQKLYGKVPESMGPMFEQYFRNSAMLVIEDPSSGSTLLDVSRVLADKEYRALKLSRSMNPIIIQFWRDVAEKAGGEASLANIVPYITSKFDVFLANDIMRPIVATEKTAFNLREVMDNKKILLVNLSKGRLGDINANLIGLIIVGKILLSALSRVDSLGKDLPPFYLYIDEFQNVTTNSIATILSEARKYKLSLTVAHQFIAQLEEDIKNAVFGNVGTICAFRVGADDAKYLESQFAPVFSADDLMNIDNRKAYLRMLVDGRPVDPFDIEIPAPREVNREIGEKIRNLSRTKYGRSRSEAEAEIRAKYQKS